MADRKLSPSASRPAPRRLLSREESAAYLCVSPSKFDEMRTAGSVPPAKLIASKKVWDVYELDMVCDALPREDAKDESWVDFGGDHAPGIAPRSPLPRPPRNRKAVRQAEGV